MKAEAIRIIRDEHSAISAVLYTLRYLVKRMRDGGDSPDFPLLRAILDYIVSYPDRWHHPKEDKYLFAAVRRRTRKADALIARLEQEHQLGHPLVDALKTQLIAFQAGADGGRDAFFEQAGRYVELEWAHMRSEEEQLFPLAEQHLTAADWVEIHTAFVENDNPLFGIKPKDDAERLYRKILHLAPAPIGYGD